MPAPLGHSRRGVLLRTHRALSCSGCSLYPLLSLPGKFLVITVFHSNAPLFRGDSDYAPPLSVNLVFLCSTCCVSVMEARRLIWLRDRGIEGSLGICSDGVQFFSVASSSNTTQVLPKCSISHSDLDSLAFTHTCRYSLSAGSPLFLDPPLPCP